MTVLWKTELGEAKITRVECRLATPHFVVRNNGARESRENRYHKYHNSFAAAKRYLIIENNTRLRNARRHYEDLLSIEKILNKLKEPNEKDTPTDPSLVSSPSMPAAVCDNLPGAAVGHESHPVPVHPVLPGNDPGLGSDGPDSGGTAAN